MKDSEPGETQQYIEEHCIENYWEILYQQISPMEQPVDGHTTKHDYQAVNQKDTPVW